MHSASLLSRLYKSSSLARPSCSYYRVTRNLPVQQAFHTIQFIEPRNPHAILTKTLSEEQWQAIEHVNGSVLVVGPRGSGKTLLAARKVLALPERVSSQACLLTPSRQSASLLQALVDINSNIHEGQRLVLSVQSFCELLLREFGSLAGGAFSREIRVVPVSEMRLFLHRHIGELTADRLYNELDPHSSVKAMHQTFQHFQVHNLSPEQLRRDKALTTGTDNMKELLTCYQASLELSEQHGIVDWTGLIYRTSQMLESSPDVVARARERFQHVIVDDYERCSPAMRDVLRHFDRNSTEYGGLTKLLDPTIEYANTISSPIVTKSLYEEEAASNALSISLTTRFQRTEEILACLERAQGVVLPLLEGGVSAVKLSQAWKQRATTNTVTKGFVNHVRFETFASEIDFIVEECKKYANEDHLTCAVVVYGLKEAQTIFRALRMEGISAQPFFGTTKFTDRAVQMIMSFLGTLVDPSDSRHVYSLLLSPAYNFPVDTVLTLSKEAAKTHSNLLAVLTARANTGSDGQSVEDFKRVSSFVQDIAYFKEALPKHSAEELVHLFLERTGLIEKYANPQTLDDDEQSVALADFMSLVADAQTAVGSRDAPFVFPHLVNLRDRAQSIPRSQASANYYSQEDRYHVVVTTPRDIDGLEADVVFLSAFTDSRVPGRFRKPGLLANISHDKKSQSVYSNEQLQKVFQILSSARHGIIITASHNMGTVKGHMPSRFWPLLFPDGKFETPAANRAREITSAPVGSETEIESPADQGDVLYMSYSKIDTYLRCPKRYYFQRKMNLLAEGNHFMALGNSLHEGVAAYAKYVREHAHFPQLEILTEAFESSWRKGVFSTPTQERLLFQRGLLTLKEFLLRQKDDGFVPRYIEDSFELPLDEHNIVLRGVWDRIDVSEDGKRVRIVEFKSRLRNDVQKLAASSLQLKLYALAYQQLHDGLLPQEAWLECLESGARGVWKPAESELEKAKEIMVSVADKIREEKFDATPSYMNCKYCQFSHMCEDAILGT